MAYIILIFIGFIPSLAWLFFFLQEDVHPEPKKMLVKVFWGGILITFLAIFFQMHLENFLYSYSLENLHPLPFFLFALVEEALKFLVAWVIIKRSRFFDEPVDAMIYMIVASLGFALVENVAIALDAEIIPRAIETLTIRLVGATLLHALSSAIVGYYWAKGIIISRIKAVFIFKGIIIATLVHTIFNYLILVSNKAIMVYPTIFLTIIALFIFWDFDKIKSTNNS